MENWSIWLQIVVVLGLLGVIGGMIYGLIYAISNGPPSQRKTRRGG